MTELLLVLAIVAGLIGLTFDTVGRLFEEDQQDPPSHRH